MTGPFEKLKGLYEQPGRDGLFLLWDAADEQSWNLASGEQISEVSVSALQMERYMKGRIRTVHVTHEG
jgi:hypothetical protein